MIRPCPFTDEKPRIDESAYVDELALVQGRVSIGARSSIYDLIMDLARAGVAVIVVSSDLEEVLGVSNRIMVMAQGKQAGILDREDANDVSVMELATI